MSIDTYERTWNKLLSITLIVVVIGALVAIAYSLVATDDSDEFTDFYILSENGEAGHYPQELTIGQEGNIIIGVTNHEGEDAGYRIEVVANGLILNEMGPFHVSDNENWESELNFSLPLAGANQKVEFFIYKDQATDPYLEPLHLWVNITKDDGTLPTPLPYTEGITIDHYMVTSLFSSGSLDLSIIPEYWIDQAKSNLHIAYGHTSHGSQIITGMTGLMEWKGDLYAWDDNGGLNGALDLDDHAFSSERHDLGWKGELKWEELTREFLNDPTNSDVNVVMWAWCGGVSETDDEGIDVYLNAMNQLQIDYPNVEFVYMTGHADGSGISGNLHIRNQQIRDYCEATDKILYDFYDIECYDPDGNYFGDKFVDDGCRYDGGNWAIEWQNSHTQGIDWYECESAHSQPVNANQKAYAAWWMFARIAGWDGV